MAILPRAVKPAFHPTFQLLPARLGSDAATDAALPLPPAGTSRLDRSRTAAYRAVMDRSELLAQLHTLATRLDELAERSRRMGDENRSLRQQQEQLAGERAALLAKNEQARTRVEAMIARLKSLEQHT